MPVRGGGTSLNTLQHEERQKLNAAPTGKRCPADNQRFHNKSLPCGRRLKVTGVRSKIIQSERPDQFLPLPLQHLIFLLKQKKAYLTFPRVYFGPCGSRACLPKQSNVSGDFCGFIHLCYTLTHRASHVVTAEWSHPSSRHSFRMFPS